MDNITEIVLHMPWEVVDDCNGFGLDFGKLDHNLEFLDKIIYKFDLTNRFKALFQK